MTTIVAKNNLVSVPPTLAAELAIKPGTVLSWEHGSEPGVLRVSVMRSRAEIASSLLGAGRKYLRPGQNPVGDLIEERAREDCDRAASL
jgi:hypothetical protein